MISNDERNTFAAYIQIPVRKNYLTAVCCFAKIMRIDTSSSTSNIKRTFSSSCFIAEMNSKLFLVTLVLCAAVATRGADVSGSSSCEGVNGTECKSKEGALTKTSSDPITGVLMESGASDKAPSAKKNACYYSRYYTGYVPTGYYKCAGNYWLKFNTLGLVYSSYCYNARVYGTVYAYVITTGTCKISFIQYGFYTKAVQIRAYYCC